MGTLGTAPQDIGEVPGGAGGLTLPCLYFSISVKQSGRSSESFPRSDTMKFLGTSDKVHFSTYMKIANDYVSLTGRVTARGRVA